MRFALSTWDEYQEYVLHWSVRYRTATKVSGTYRFGTLKSVVDCEWMKRRPVPTWTRVRRPRLEHFIVLFNCDNVRRPRPASTVLLMRISIIVRHFACPGRAEVGGIPVS